MATNLKKLGDKLNDQLCCSICLDTYDDPKLLQCFHVFCRKCLVKLVVRDQQGQLVTPCPKCRLVTPSPASGVAGLQAAFHIIPLLEIKNAIEQMQKDMENQDDSHSKFKTPSTNDPGLSYCCSEHVKKQLELYCEDCSELICLECAINDGKHHGHNYCRMYEAYSRYQQEIESSLKPMEAQLAVLNKSLENLNARCIQVSDQQSNIEADINSKIGQLHEVLNSRKAELIDKLYQTTQAKLKALDVQRDQIETIQAQVNSCLEFMRASLRSGNQVQVLEMKALVSERVKELCIPIQHNTLQPMDGADVKLSVQKGLKEACQSYGQVVTLDCPDPTKCFAKENTSVGGKFTKVIQAMDYRGISCTKPIQSLECDLVSMVTGIKAKGTTVERIGQGLYQISYLPTIPGKHQLHIKISGQHIKGSPFEVSKKALVEKVTTPSLILGRVEFPCSVTITSKQEVVVSEMNRHCIAVVNAMDGRKVSSFGTFGSGQGQFMYPSGVAIDNDKNLLVVDSNNNRIQKFTPDGHFLKAVGTEGSGRLQFVLPKGIAFNFTNNKVYITDEHRVVILNSDLTFFNSFGEEGNDQGQFDIPIGIAIDNTGHVYVADKGNHRIQVFTAKGKFVRMFGRRGEGRGELKSVTGIAIDKTGTLYVSDRNSSRILVFTSLGQFIRSFGRIGEEPGEFLHPRGLAVDSDGKLYVCDCSNYRIQIFK